MTPKLFLYIAGVILLALGIFGFIFPDPFGDTSVLQLDNWQNAIHVILGVVAIGAAYMFGRRLHWWLTAIYGLAALVTAGAAFLLRGEAAPNIGGANLENPVETIFYLAVGLWAAVVAVYYWRDMRMKPGMVEEEAREPEEPSVRKAA
ncbi:MAG: hypothetical protein IBX61_06070 [Thermoleophilia bacterium]|nr:hypothetical protein [Thermoleophilia bacterium]